MNRLYLLVIVSIFIIVPTSVEAFFRINPNNITVVRNISCRLNANTTSENNFQLCAIRVYNGTGAADASIFNVFDGLRYVNTFRHFIQKNCPGWPTTDTGIADIGAMSCNSNPAFKSFEQTQLCICATDNCNQDWNSCSNSVQNSSNITSLLNLMPDLNSTIQCDDTLNATNICDEHPFVPVFICQGYVTNNSVMCAITVNGTGTIQTLLIDENYEAYLDEKIYQVKSASDPFPDSTIETANNAYYKYSNGDTTVVEECACINVPFCNQNISTCSSLNNLQVETTMSASSLTYNPSTISTDVSTPGTLGTDSYTSVSTITTPASAGSTITTAASAGSVITTAASADSTITTAASAGSTITTAASADSTITTAASTDSTITTATSTDSIPTIISSPLPPYITSTTGQTSVTNEPGLGRSATAGIACGIIFSALIFTAEIIFFKFFYSGNLGNTNERSVAYRA